jgi:FMN-dependent NADH-azoreductase
MRKLLYVNSSPRGERSESRTIAETFLQSYREERPGAVIDSLDLWSERLPVYGGAGVEAKMEIFAGRTPSGDAEEAWNAVRALFERFNDAEDYLFTVPMWNHSVPWVLKHFIDAISQPGMVFGFDPVYGYSGLLQDKRAVVVYTSGVYSNGVPLAFGQDFHRRYFNDWLRWAGVDDVTEITFQPTIVNSDADAARGAALAQARSLGRSFATRELALR